MTTSGSTSPCAPMIDAVAIGVPARNEEARIEACIRSILVAANACRVPTSIVVVSDSSDDATVDIARNMLVADGPDLVEVLDRRFGRVGPARDLACRHALALHGDVDTSRIWIATTDADSEVPPDWLTSHLNHQRTGLDGVAGLVKLDEREVSESLRAKFQSAILNNGLEYGHPHVHGANLGIVGAAFLAAGGFGDVSVGEDQQLWQRAKAAGFRVTGTTDGVVVTSGRRVGRARGGLATFLEELESC
jgi:glycosyltransferase involved in cell wall biosynthesis